MVEIGGMRTRYRLLVALFGLAGVLGVASPASAMRDPGPIIVCVTDPCPGIPGLPRLPPLPL